MPSVPDASELSALQFWRVSTLDVRQQAECSKSPLSDHVEECHQSGDR